jgi:hypothetical protein
MSKNNNTVYARYNTDTLFEFLSEESKALPEQKLEILDLLLNSTEEERKKQAMLKLAEIRLAHPEWFTQNSGFWSSQIILLGTILVAAVTAAIVLPYLGVELKDMQGLIIAGSVLGGVGALAAVGEGIALTAHAIRYNKYTANSDIETANEKLNEIIKAKPKNEIANPGFFSGKILNEKGEKLLKKAAGIELANK